MNTFGERLRNLRQKKNLSQAELSTRLNIAKSTLAMYETDKREPSFETIQRISGFFDVTTDYLLTGNNPDKPSPDPATQYPILHDIDPELLQKFAETIREDPYQSLFFDDILSADREEREQIVREWLELRKKYKDRKKDEPPEDDGPSAWDIVRNKK